MKSYTYGTTPNDAILKAMQEALGDRPYPMKLSPPDAEPVIAAVNQGIDLHLEAITDSTFKWNVQGKLVCHVAHKDMLVLLRRLGESEDENAQSLRISILQTINIEEI